MRAYDALAKYYDSLTTDVPYGTFADFYEQIFKLYNYTPSTLLDLACGTGSLTKILAQRGYDMTASDASAEMLTEAMDKMSELDTLPLLLCQRMEELDLYGTVDGIICSLDGINYASPDKLPEIFHRVNLFLEPGGIFIFDINTPEKLMGLDGEMFVDENDDVFCVWRAEYDKDINACIYGMDIFAKRGKLWSRNREEHIEYIYNEYYMKTLLTDNGFESIRVFGELVEGAPRTGEQRIFIAASKPKLAEMK